MNSKKKYQLLIEVQTSILLIIIVLYIILHTNIIKFIPECIFFSRFGLLCPSCGGTRFMICLLKFDLINAFYMHPLFFILIIYFIVLNISFIINTILSKKINIFKWWHIVFWAMLLLVFTIFRNIKL